MTPGTYLQKRRMAAGLTVDELARQLGRNPVQAANWATRIRMFEDDVDVVAQVTLVVLRGIFAFKPEIYLAMVHETRHGAVCRMCACSMFDPCQESSGQPCAWAEDDLCTACASNRIIRPALVPSEPIYEICASDPFAPALLTMLGQLHTGQWRMAGLTVERLLRQQVNAPSSHPPIGNQATGEDALRVAAAMVEWRSTTLGAMPGALPSEESTRA
ncbi:MAG: hypothetical protein JWQ16_1727 [Novosphingobium sp.]|nr:hypothetical protein [Novosphingobium sp.]